MVVGYILGTVSGVEVLGPSVLAVFGANVTSAWPNVAIAVALGVAMLVIAAVGIRLTARTQVGMAVVEYAILAVFAIIGIVAVLGHHSGTVPVSSGWFSLSGIGGRGSALAGLLIAVFAFSGSNPTENGVDRMPNPRMPVNRRTERGPAGRPGNAALTAMLRDGHQPG